MDVEHHDRPVAGGNLREVRRDLFGVAVARLAVGDVQQRGRVAVRVGVRVGVAVGPLGVGVRVAVLVAVGVEVDGAGGGPSPPGITANLLPCGAGPPTACWPTTPSTA